MPFHTVHGVIKARILKWLAIPFSSGPCSVRQEMARVNVDILGISELKWTGMGEFNSDDHYIYYCGQESLRRNGAFVRDESGFGEMCVSIHVYAQAYKEEERS